MRDIFCDQNLISMEFWSAERGAEDSVVARVRSITQGFGLAVGA
jgi:hypothetical protein